MASAKKTSSNSKTSSQKSKLGSPMKKKKHHHNLIHQKNLTKQAINGKLENHQNIQVINVWLPKHLQHSMHVMVQVDQKL